MTATASLPAPTDPLYLSAVFLSEVAFTNQSIKSAEAGSLKEKADEIRQSTSLDKIYQQIAEASKEGKISALINEILGVTSKEQDAEESLAILAQYGAICVFRCHLEEGYLYVNISTKKDVLYTSLNMMIIAQALQHIAQAHFDPAHAIHKSFAPFEVKDRRFLAHVSNGRVCIRYASKCKDDDSITLSLRDETCDPEK